MQSTSRSSGVTTALGGGASVNADGTINAPTYNIAGASYRNVGDAFTAVDNNFVRNKFFKLTQDAVPGPDAIVSGPSSIAIGSGSNADSFSTAIGSNSKSAQTGVALGYNSEAGALSATAVGATALAGSVRSVAIGSLSTVDATADLGVAIGRNAHAIADNAVALGANSTADRDNSVSIGKSGSERLITNLAKGTADTDGVNVSQLKGVTTALGGGAGVNADGTIKAPSYTVQGQSGIADVGTALGRLDTATTTNTTNITNLGGRVTTAEGDINTIETNVTNLGGRVTTVEGNVTNLTTQITNCTIGLVKQDPTTRTVTVAKDSNGKLVDFTGTAGVRKLTGLDAGTLSAASSDAVNGAQLYATNQNVAKNTTDITNLGGRVTTVEGNVTNVQNTLNTINNGGGIKYFHSNTALGDSVTTGADSIAIGGNAASEGKWSLAVGTNSKASGDNSVALGNSSLADRANSVSVGNSGTQRQITNLAKGTADTDAVNVSQLEGVTTALGGGATVDANGNVKAPSYTVQGQSGIADVGTALGKLDTATTTNTTNITNLVTTVEGNVNNLTTKVNNGTIGPVQRTAAGQLSLIAAGGDATAPGAAQVLANVAKGTVSASSTNAVNGSQLFALADSAADALGGGSTVNTDGSISAPSYTVGGTTVNNVGAAITNLDGRTTQNTTNIAGNTTAINNVTNNINNGTIGLVKQDPTTRTVTVAKGTNGTLVDFAGTDGVRKLTGADNGTLSANSTDVVNGSQLYATNQKVAENTTNIANLDGRVIF